jgi:hypothetical protein
MDKNKHDIKHSPGGIAKSAIGFAGIFGPFWTTLTLPPPFLPIFALVLVSLLSDR